MLRVAPPRKTRPPDHIRVNWPVDASASGLAQVGPGGRHRWAARVQVGQEPARQKAWEGYPSHYTSLLWLPPSSRLPLIAWLIRILLATWWISNCMPSKVWDEIAYPLPNFNNCTVEVWEWISNFIPHFMIDATTYPCCNIVNPCR